jgi:hypothetical protein
MSWVKEMCFDLDFEKLVHLPPKIKHAIHNYVNDLLKTHQYFKKKWLAELIIDFIDMLHLGGGFNYNVDINTFNHGKQIEIKRELSLTQRFNDERINDERFNDKIIKMFDLSKKPISIFYNTTLQNVGDFINKIKVVNQNITWFFNGILQTGQTDSHILQIKDRKKIEYYNLQSGIWPESDIVNYLSKILHHNKIDIFVRKESSWGIHEVISIVIALRVLKNNGFLFMKIDPIFTIFKMKLLYMISECFEHFNLHIDKGSMFVTGRNCKPLSVRQNVIDQLMRIVEEKHVDMTADLLCTTVTEEKYVLFQYFAYAFHYRKKD